MTKDPGEVEEEAVRNQRDDQVEPMHRGAKAEADDFSDGPRETDSERGPAESERGQPANPGGSTGEHSGQTPDASTPKKRG